MQSVSPKKNEREAILIHLKELGDSEATDHRAYNWFTRVQREPKQVPPLTSASNIKAHEARWVDSKHKTRKSLIPVVVSHFILSPRFAHRHAIFGASVWLSLTRESLKDLKELHAEFVAEDPNTEIPCEPWAKILDAKPVHVRMWCKA